jgi:general secretion pathway protein C
METLLRRHPWAFDLIVVMLCATLCGLAASGVVSMWQALPPPRLSRPPPLKSESTAAFDKRPDGIIARNIFCSDCPPFIATADADGDASAATENRTTLPLALLAIMYAEGSRVGNLSIAVLKDTDSKHIGAFAMGDRIHGATITDIRETRIYLDNETTREYLDLLETPAPRVALASVAVAPRARNAVTSELERGIKKVGEHRYEVQRRTLESVLENVGLLSHSVHPMPEMKNGKMAGFRLFAVHPDGPVAKIGMKNGDVLSSINGLEITSPEKVIEAFAKLRSASHLSLQVERDGQKLTNEYIIH